jgi:phenylalanine-4-hydroxylase
VAARTAFPITTYQPTYFCAQSLQDAKDRMREYCQELPRPFYATWNPATDTIHIDRPVQRTKGSIPDPAAE